jgi:SAM-dependent methyltransferase
VPDPPPEPVFAPNLFRGTAADYDRFRLGYPDALIEHLRTELGLDGTGRLLDLGAATGQVARALAPSFAEVWAVDAEPDMIEYASAHYPDIRWFLARAEDFDAPPAHFDLVTAGNCFHRFDRPVVAANVAHWLKPRGALAVLWSSSPSDDSGPWQAALRQTIEEWTVRAGAADRAPSGWQRHEYPDEVVLREAGFARIEKRHFPTRQMTTVDELIGFLRSTSFASREAMGKYAEEFYADVAARLRGADPSGEFEQVIDHALMIARRS